MQVQQHIWLILLPLSIGSCVEPFEPEIVNFESALVVEATITDENKLQEVLLSRAFPLDTMGIYGESGAVVQITDSEGATFDFTHQGDGRYVSNASFAARNGIGYQLKIITTDGKEYMSEEEMAPAPTQIDSLYAERDFKDGDANEGIFIYVDSFDPSGESKYYRYEYEETYKIIAPYWAERDFFMIEGQPLSLPEILPRKVLNQTCYNTIRSIDIIQNSTEELDQNKVTKFPVKFIDRGDFKITYRYSVLVRQFVQTQSAYQYYKTLEKLNSSESVFSQFQNGFLEGNLYSDQNINEKVVGYFQVSSVSKKRLFFNYEDFFLGESRPKYAVQCPILNARPSLINGVYDLAWFDDYDPVANPLNFSPEPNPWIAVPRPCSDCRALGSIVVPEFWVE